MSFYNCVVSSDTISLLQPMFEAGTLVVNPKDGKIWDKIDLFDSSEYGVNGWIYTNNPTDYHCGFWRDVAKVLKYIPTNCLNCWKTVVRPANLQELFNLFQMQLKMVEKNPECYCKLGIEQRPFVFGSYGGYFYNRTLEAGKERYEQVREAVNNTLQQGKDTSVILKRGCTEYEMDFGPSPEYKQPEMAHIWEEMIARDVILTPYTYKQPELIQQKTFKMWMKFAWDRGDPSLFKYTNGTHLVPSCVTYHDKNLEK